MVETSPVPKVRGKNVILQVPEAFSTLEAAGEYF